MGIVAWVEPWAAVVCAADKHKDPVGRKRESHVRDERAVVQAQRGRVVCLQGPTAKVELQSLECQGGTG